MRFNRESVAATKRHHSDKSHNRKNIKHVIYRQVLRCVEWHHLVKAICVQWRVQPAFFRYFVTEIFLEAHQ